MCNATAILAFLYLFCSFLLFCSTFCNQSWNSIRNKSRKTIFFLYLVAARTRLQGLRNIKTSVASPSRILKKQKPKKKITASVSFISALLAVGLVEDWPVTHRSLPYCNLAWIKAYSLKGTLRRICELHVLAIAELVERRWEHWKVSDPLFNSRTGIASLEKTNWHTYTWSGPSKKAVFEKDALEFKVLVKHVVTAIG